MNMNRITWKTYLFWILLSKGVGLLAALLTRDGITVYNQSAVKPAFAPPAILFPIVWTILYALMGISAARVSQRQTSSQKNAGLNLFVTQLIINFFWSLIFFNARAYGLAFLWILLLWVLILAMIIQFRKVDKPAAFLQIPYLLWVTFASLLNFSVWQLNK